MELKIVYYLTSVLCTRVQAHWCVFVVFFNINICLCVYLYGFYVDVYLFIWIRLFIYMDVYANYMELEDEQYSVEKERLNQKI